MNLKGGLIRAYDFDSNSIDKIGGQNGIDNNVIYSKVLGYRNLGINFSGSSSSYVIASGSGLPLSNQPFSVAVKFKSTADGIAFYGYGTVSAEGYRNCLGIFGGGKFYFTGFGVGDLNSNIVVNDGNIHTGVVTFNGTTMKMYIDGIFKVSGTPSLNVQSSSLYIGKTSENDGYYNGSLNYLYFWNRVLSDNEIAYIDICSKQNKSFILQNNIFKLVKYQALYSTNITISSTVVSGVISAQAPSISTGSKSLPNVLSAVFSSQTPVQKSAVTIPANIINAIFSIPTINVITPDASISPNSQNAVFSIPTPTISIIYPNVTVNPSTQDLTFTIQTPTTYVEVSTYQTPNSLNATFNSNSVSIYTEKSETILSSVVNMYISVLTPKKTGGLWAQVPRLEGDWTPVPRVS
jgi:hypothetical protein